MRSFNDLKLIAKLALPAGLVLLMAAGLLLMARSGLDTLRGATDEIVDGQVNRVVAALRMADALNAATIAQKGVIVEGSGDVLQPSPRSTRRPRRGRAGRPSAWSPSPPTRRSGGRTRPPARP